MLDSIKNIIDDFSNRCTYGNRDLSTFLKISVNWNSIVGATLSKICKPIFYSNGNLTVIVIDATWANEIMFFKSKIIKKVEDLASIKIKNIITRIGEIEDTENSKNSNNKEDERFLTDDERVWIDNIIKDIDDDTLKNKLAATLGTYIKTGGSR